MNVKKLAKRQDRICEYLEKEYYRLSDECFAERDKLRRDYLICQINELQLFLKYLRCGEWKIVEVKTNEVVTTTNAKDVIEFKYYGKIDDIVHVNNKSAGDKE